MVRKCGLKVGSLWCRFLMVFELWFKFCIVWCGWGLGVWDVKDIRCSCGIVLFRGFLSDSSLEEKMDVFFF